MSRKKKEIDLSPLNYFVGIPQDKTPSKQTAEEPEIQVEHRTELQLSREDPPPFFSILEHSPPVKKQPGRSTIEKERRSKTFSICVTPSLYEDLRLLSELNGVSVNSYIVGLLNGKVEENRIAVDQMKEVKRKFNKMQ